MSVMKSMQEHILEKIAETVRKAGSFDGKRIVYEPIVVMSHGNIGTLYAMNAEMDTRFTVHFNFQDSYFTIVIKKEGESRKAYDSVNYESGKSIRQILTAIREAGSF